MKQSIIVADIRDTKNPQVKQLFLKAIIEKPATANPVSFFLKGVPNVAPSTETRTYFQSVSTDVIAAHKIEVGSNFHEVFKNFPNAKLIVRETFEQKKWDGGEQSPKINPSTGQAVTKEGRMIYRNVELSLDGLLEDNYIQHDPTSRTETSTQGSSIESLANQGSKLKVEEPVLPA